MNNNEQHHVLPEDRIHLAQELIKDLESLPSPLDRSFRIGEINALISELQAAQNIGEVTGEEPGVLARLIVLRDKAQESLEATV